MHITPTELRREVDLLAQREHSLEELERDLIEPAPLAEDEKAALWLYAWTRTGARS